MPANLATVDALLKDVYAPAIKNQLNDECPLAAEFDKAEDFQFEGRQIIESVRVGRNRGGYYAAEGGGIPTAGNQKHEVLRIPPRYLYGAIQITKQAMDASRSNKGAFARVMRQEMDGLLSDLRMTRNRTLAYDGRGVLALASADPTTTTSQNVDAPGGVAGSTNGSRFIHEGMYVGWVDPDTGGIRPGGTRLVSTVPAAGTSFTVSAAINTATEDNDYIVTAYGSDASLTIGNTSYMKEPMGLLGMIDDGTYVNIYFGLSRTDFPILKSTTITSVGALSADVLQRATDVVTQLAGKSVSSHWMHPSVRRAYLGMTEADRRYTLGKLLNPDAGTNAAKGGYDNTVEFGGVPLKIDWSLPYGFWFGFQKDNAYRYPVDEGSWVDEDGSVLVRSSSAIDTFDAQYRIHENFAHLRPNSCFVLSGITATVVSVRVR